MVVAATNDYQAVNTTRLIGRHSNNAAASVQRLSSGVRINTAADDPAGIVTAAKLKGRATGATAAAQNAQNGASMAKTADTAYGNALDILYRMREIVSESGDTTLESDGLTGLQTEFDLLNGRLADIAKTSYGGQALFGDHSYYLGMDGTQSSKVTFTAVSSVAKTTLKAADVSKNTKTIDDAIKTMSANQAKTGGAANALGYIADGLNTDSSNMWDAYTSFTETNVAKEMSSYVKNTVYTQSAQLILSQYNQNAYSVLNLLR